VQTEDRRQSWGERDGCGGAHPAGPMRRLPLAAADDLTDEVLDERLYPPPALAARDRRPQPNWAAVHRKLRRPGVTLQLLWEEHRALHPDGYGYSRFCELYLRSPPVADDSARQHSRVSGR